MTVLIIEDESLAAERLKSMLLEIDPNTNVVAQLASIESSVQWLSTNPHPDLIFSDIRLLDGLCFEIFAQVTTTKPIVFTTAYDQYAIKAFEVNSLDYLLKPIAQEKLQRAFDKFKQRQMPPAVIPYQDLIRLVSSGGDSFKSRFMIKLGQKIIALPVEKIAYFYTENKLTFAITTDNKRFPLDQPLDELVEMLDPKVFFRINRQFIISYSSIAEIHPYFKGRVKLTLQPSSTEEVIISSERTPDFKSWIDQ